MENKIFLWAFLNMMLKYNNSSLFVLNQLKWLKCHIGKETALKHIVWNLRYYFKKLDLDTQHYIISLF